MGIAGVYICIHFTGKLASAYTAVDVVKQRLTPEGYIAIV